MGFLSKLRDIQKGSFRPEDKLMGPGGPERERIFARGPKRDNFGNLREAIQRLKEKRGGDMGMPRMPRIDDGRMRAMPIGPGEMPQLNFGMEQMPTSLGNRMIGTPQPIPERMPTDPSSYFNPTIFGQQMGDMDFSQMPEISPVDMSNLQMPTLPREISQMDLPQMPEGLPSMQDVQGMPQMGMRGMRDMQPRQMMAEGDEAINRSPEQEIFSLQSQLENLEEQLRMDRSYNDDQAVIDTSAQMAAIQNRIKEIMNEGGYPRTNSTGRTMSELEIMQEGRPQLAGGGDFPDLTGDGKVTQADILKGRGVKMMYGGEMKGYENGGEIEGMLSGMESPMGEEEAMAELEQVQPEMEMIEQLVMMVTQMIQQGASEQEVMGLLREQGLDDEDIATVLQLVAEMGETEDQAEATAAQNEIGNQLTELG